MKTLFAALSVLVATTAYAATSETFMLTYPTELRFVYDADRDTAGGQTPTLKIEGGRANGRVAGGTGTNVVTVYGDMAITGSRNTYFFETFGEGAAGKGLSIMKFDGTAATTAQLGVNVMYTGSGNKIYLINNGGSANTTVPVMASTGLDISGEQTSGDGWELTLGQMYASGQAFIIGTSPAFFSCATFTLADASGDSTLQVGFRRLEVTNATYGSYTEYAGIGLSGTSNPNTIQIIDEVDANLDGTGDGGTTTDTTDTWADAATKTLCTYVSAAGVVTYTNNGAAPTATHAITLTDGQIVIPHIYFLNGGDLGNGTILNDWEVGYQAASGVQ